MGKKINMEYFELLDESGQKLGRCKERTRVHQDGDWHGGSHIWVVKREQNTGSMLVLLQKRRMDKDSFPGCYDVSCAGHMTAGEDFLSTAIRELSEELNIIAKQEDLKFLFSQQVEGEYTFHKRPFRNREVNYVYLLEETVSLERLSYQKEEIESLKWIEIEQLRKKLLNEQNKFCIIPEELERVYEEVKEKWK